MSLKPAPLLKPKDVPAVLDQQPAMLQPAKFWTITPEMATCLLGEHDRIVEMNKKAGLARDGHNRAIRGPDITTYASDMRAGRWSRNGTTISRTWSGIWADGQHRLMACIEAGVPFETFIVFGVDLSAQDTMDTGIKRRTQDQLNLRGEPNSTNLSAIARWRWRWVRGARTRSGYAVPNPSQLELLDFIEEDPRLRLAASFAVKAYHDSRRKIRTTVFGMAWILFKSIDNDYADSFFEGIITGANLPIGSPMLTMRNRMDTAKDSNERLSEHEQLALMISAWNAYHADRTISKLPLPAGGLKPTNFPEPR